MSRAEAEALLAEVLHPINAGVCGGTPQLFTFESFVQSVFFKVRRQGWKVSTAMTSAALIEVSLSTRFGPL
jgi:hypothetical protein